MKLKNGYKSLKSNFVLKMIKTIFLHNLSNFFRERSLRSDRKNKFDEICQKDGFCYFWGKIRF